MRRLLIALLLLSATPAQAAPRSLADFQDREAFALAGDLVLYTRGADALAVPAGGGTPRTVFSHPTRAEAPVLAASATRAAITTRTEELAQAFSGPPGGPWAALGPPVHPALGEPWPLEFQVDGDRLFSFEYSNSLQQGSVVVRDPDPRAVPFPTGRDAVSAVFAGDLVAYKTATGRQLVVREWRTGAQRTVADLPEPIDLFDLRPDGRAVVTVTGDLLYDVPPGGVPRRLTRGHHPRFAGDHIVFARGDALRVLDPGGRIRAIGVPTTDPGSFVTDATRVLWEANGCLLIAAVTDRAASAPGPGPCPRSEVILLEPADPKLARTIALTLRCVAGPCRGTIRLRLEDQHRLNPAQRYSIPTGADRRLRVRLSVRGLRALRDRIAREEFAKVTVELRTSDGHRVRPDGPNLLVHR